MSRVRLEVPASFPFSTEMTVRVTDVNYGGHLGNDAVLGLVHEARIRFLSSLGFSEKNAGGPGVIMTEAVVIYRAEAFLGDRLLIGVGVGEIRSHGCDFLYRLTNASTSAEVARVRTGMAFYDYGVRRIVPVPGAFRNALGQSP